MASSNKSSIFAFRIRTRARLGKINKDEEKSACHIQYVPCRI